MNGFGGKIKLVSNTLSVRYHETLNEAVSEVRERGLEHIRGIQVTCMDAV